MENEHLRRSDPAVHDIVLRETARQEDQLEMIASENFVSRATLEAVGTVLTNKYAEGYPGRRYYGGCEVVDEVEELARSRAKELFGADHANVQPHSGSQANMAAYNALLEPGETILGMNLSEGGHLTHGSPVNFSGRTYDVVAYGVGETDHRVDYDRVRELAREHRPRVIVAGASAYPRVLEFDRFAEIAREVDALLLVDMAHIAGMVAVGMHPDPVPHADVVTTTTHKTLRGPRGGMILCREEHAREIDRQIFPGIQGGPLMHVIAGKAVALGEALRPDFREYIGRVLENARVLAETLTERGFDLVSGGTDTHLLLVDVRNRGLTGKEAEARLEAAGVTVNKNTVPGETESPFVTSGIRIGTPALTTRGFGPEEMRRVGGMMDEVLSTGADDDTVARVRSEVRALCEAFPIYAGEGVAG